MSTGLDKLYLRPVARMVKILGEHLIRDNTVGVMELIKNGYDADAEKVIVELKNLSDPSRTEIIIEDDGTGMDEATIKGPWSEPAHGGKQEDKDRLKTTKKGRLPLGEKGVGRFAAQKLGRFLDLVTRPAKSDVEYHVSIDWETFNKSDTYLYEIGFPLEKRKPEVFSGDRHGTRLVIRDAKIPWKRSDVEKLQAALIKLLSPTNVTQDFAVEFRCPDYPELQQLDRGDILGRYQFKIDCYIDEKGRAKYTYFHRAPDGKVQESIVPDVYIWSQSSDDWQKFDPACGPLHVVIYAWLRKTEVLNAYGISKAQLDALSGIGIYRDGFRILPYGDAGDDWLGLDLRRTNQPGQKYGNNQVIGIVEINQFRNKSLIDKTNREGLQENQAYADMRSLVLSVLSLLETESLEERAKVTKPPESAKTLRAQVQELRQKIEELQKKPQKLVEVPPEQPPIADTRDQGAAQSAATKAAVVEVPAKDLERIREQAESISTSAEETIQELSQVQEEKREAFLHLMGIGLAAERFTHEFDRLVNTLDANMKALEKLHPFETPTKALRRIVAVLKNEVELMSVARYTRKVEEHPKTKVRDVIDLSLEAHSDSIEENNIQVDYQPGEDFTVEISTASLSQVIDNVITNAIYWLGVKSELNDRKLSIDVDAKKRTLVISNNGALIPHNIKKALFKAPFVTSKPNGRGLGLYICHEILKRHNATIEILDERDQRNKYESASFIISFNTEE